MDILKPTLTENLSKFHIRNSLKEVRIKKNKFITIFFNIFVFLLFVGSIGGFLYYKYKGKLTEEEKEIKDN